MIKREDYFRKFRAWGSVYMNQYPSEDWKPFYLNLETVLRFAETLELPKKAEPDTICDAIENALKMAPEDVKVAWSNLHIPIYKSYCLSRLIYGGEELRTTPCPEHKGRWSFWRNCVCGDSGFLPN